MFTEQDRNSPVFSRRCPWCRNWGIAREGDGIATYSGLCDFCAGTKVGTMYDKDWAGNAKICNCSTCAEDIDKTEINKYELRKTKVFPEQRFRPTGPRNMHFGQREMHKATCADCKQETEVPFKHIWRQPVYCKGMLPEHRPKRYWSYSNRAFLR